MHRSVVVATIKVGVVTKSRILGKRVIAGKLRFKVVYNILFYNYFMHRSVVVATVKVSVVTKSRILGRKSSCW